MCPASVAGMAVDAQGRIVVVADVFDFVGGNSTPADFAAGRLNPNGTPDVTFAGDGTAVLDVGGEPSGALKEASSPWKEQS